MPAYTLTGTAADIPVQRILVRLGVSQDMAALLLDDFRDAVAHFSKHPVTVPMSKEESAGSATYNAQLAQAAAAQMEALPRRRPRLRLTGRPIF